MTRLVRMQSLAAAFFHRTLRIEFYHFGNRIAKSWLLFTQFVRAAQSRPRFLTETLDRKTKVIAGFSYH